MPTSKAAELGKKLHTELENYLKFGTIPKSAIAKAGIHLLPDPGKDLALHVEERVQIENDLLPVPIIGFADLIEEFSGEIRITDHKTTSNFKYCKSPDELRTDPQAIIYGAHCFNEYDPPSGSIAFRHVYYNTKSPGARETEIRMSDEEVCKGLEGLTETVIEMAETANQIAGDVKANPEACGDWGGCPFRARCAKAGNGPGGTYEALIQASKKEDKMGRFSQLLEKRKQEQKQETTEAAPEVTATPTEELSGINPPDGIPADSPGEVQSEAPKTKRGGPFFSDGTRAKALKKDELFTKFSDDTKGEIFDAYQETISTFKTRKEIIEFMEKNPGLFSSEATPPVKKKAPEPGELRGQKAIEKNPLESGEEVETPATGRNSEVQCTLYIGCHPRKKSVVYFEELVRPLQEFVAEDAEAIFYNTIPYSEGPKRVAALLFQKMKSGEIQMPEHLVMDRRMPGADACLEVLIAQATHVVERMG